jgi:WD40 repeat protein
VGDDAQSFVTWNLIDDKSTSVKLDHSLDHNSNLWALGDHLLVGKMTEILDSQLPGASHVVISKEGVLALAIGRQGEVTVSSLSTGTTLLSLDAPEVRYAGAAFIEADQHGLVALARENGAIEVWSPLSGELLYTVEGLSGPPQQLVYLQARGELFALSTDGTTTYWAVPTTVQADADALGTIANCYAAWDIGQDMKLLAKAPVCDKQTDSAITTLAGANRP